MNKYIKTLGLILGLSCASLTFTAAQGLNEENQDIWATLPDLLVYSSGIGSWADELSIYSDGSFSGIYWDSDLGMTDADYPNGMMYLCNYSGQFEVPQKISDTIYETMLMYVDTDQKPGMEEIKDGTLYVYTSPLGLDGDEFYLYLPGTPVSDLPEAALYTPRLGIESGLKAIPDGECVLYNKSSDICFVGISSSPISQVVKETYYEVMDDLPGDYTFASGAGAWGNSLLLFPDGTFDGTYHDSEMGAVGEGYPHGSVYLSNYSGHYTEPVAIDETSYVFYLTDYTTMNEPGTEEILDEILYIYTEPYGLEFADKMILYLPGTSYSKMPEAARRSPLWQTDPSDVKLGSHRYVLYNVEEDLCFFATREYDYIDEIIEEETEAPVPACEYMLPNVRTRYYTESEINQLTLQELNYAKNEIYAYHGRKFKSKELREFFNSKSWYNGTIDGDNFSTSVFNSYENQNLQLIDKREKKLGGSGGYPLDKNGYDIDAVRLGFLDGYPAN